jgi:hypothetical protein
VRFAITRSLAVDRPIDPSIASDAKDRSGVGFRRWVRPARRKRASLRAIVKHR